MAIGKINPPVAVNDGGDAGFTVNEATMHYLGDYTEQGFTWNQRFAYEYVEAETANPKMCVRNKSNKKDGNCGLFSWDATHYFSVLDLKAGDKVTITCLNGSTTLISDNVEGIDAGTEFGKVATVYTIASGDRLDIKMAKATLISKIEIEPYGVETVPVITITPKTLNLIPGATYKLSASVSPAADTQWTSSNEAVATVAADGTVTAVAAGEATISCSWASQISDATASDACVVTVANINLNDLTLAKTYDFTTMGDVTLELQEVAAGAIWNEANSKNNNVFYCTNEGLEQIAVQAAVASNKGWSIVDGQGLFLASGAGRCAAIGGIKAGQVVEFIYTGNGFYTRSDDDGIEKTPLNEGIGRAIYLAEADGMIGFELDKGNAVKQINIYEKNVLLWVINQASQINFIAFDKVDDNTYTTVLEGYWANNPNFKLIVNSGKGNYWLGTHQLTVEPEGWYYETQNEGEEFNFTLPHEYASFTLTATWEPSADYSKGWTLTIEGKDPRICYLPDASIIYGTPTSDWQEEYLLETGEGTNIKTGVLDLNEYAEDVELKMHLNGGYNNSHNWLGWGADYLTIDNENGLLADAQHDGNIKLLHADSEFGTYTVTATWVPNYYFDRQWTLKVEGKDAKIPTGISNINAAQNTDAPVYNVAGQKVQNAAAKGLYIINGKKVVK